MGINKNKCVDNVCAGGLYSLIDIKTGRLSAARSKAKELYKDDLGKTIEYKTHPITKCKLEGLKIPNWEFIKEQVLDLHTKLRFMSVPFIAWDIALTEKGLKIIEGNTSSDMFMFQTFEGQRNARIGKWMKERNYIK